LLKYNEEKQPIKHLLVLLALAGRTDPKVTWQTKAESSTEAVPMSEAAAAEPSQPVIGLLTLSRSLAHSLSPTSFGCIFGEMKGK
jgi:hypothetical protein